MSEWFSNSATTPKSMADQALRAFEAAGGDQLVQQAEAKPDLRESLAARC